MLHPEPSLLALQYTNVQLVDCNCNYSLVPLVVNLNYTL